MDVEKLIEQLRWWADNCDRTNYGCQARPFLLDAATALSTLQAENEKLRDENRRWSEATKTLSCAIENLRAELEQVKRCIEIVEHQRDAAIYDMTALMAGQCCDLCAVEYCNDRGKTEMCTAFKWRGPQKED